MQPTGVIDTAKATNSLVELGKYGQSVWLDYIRRNIIANGELKRMTEEEGVRGVTSNPSIFEKAIGGSLHRRIRATRSPRRGWNEVGKRGQFLHQSNRYPDRFHDR